MSEVLKKSEAQSQSESIIVVDPRTLQWSPLYRGLTFVAFAEPYATPVYSAMAVAAAGASMVLSFTVWIGLLAIAMPLTIVAAALVAGTAVKSWLEKKAKKELAARRRAEARRKRQLSESAGSKPLQTR